MDDVAALLAKVSKPLTRAEALAGGHLVDVTRAAAWCGFRVAAGMTVAAWQETVGDLPRLPTSRERRDMGERLRAVWLAAARVLAGYHQAKAKSPVLYFSHPTATNPSRQVRLALSAGFDAGAPYVTIALEAES